jgi:hypothetical protein
MRQNHSRFFLLFLIGAFLLTACNRPDDTAATQEQPPDISITETMQAVAIIVQQTLAAAAPSQAEAPSETPAPPSAPLPEETATPTLTATITPTSTPSTPIALVNENTNCRLGPGTVFEMIYPAVTGVELEIVSNTTVAEYVIVAIPNQGGQTCWLWTRYSEISGDLTGLPLATPPPTPTPTLTPTPTIEFSLAFALIDGCVGWDPGFTVVNTGGVIFQSALVTVTDTDLAITIHSNANNFDQRSGCAIAVTNPSLDPGEQGYVYANSYLYDPAGHAMTATVTLCTETDLNGTCISHTVNFTP